jgi:hypothetical protein
MDSIRTEVKQGPVSRSQLVYLFILLVMFSLDRTHVSATISGSALLFTARKPAAQGTIISSEPYGTTPQPSTRCAQLGQNAKPSR